MATVKLAIHPDIQSTTPLNTLYNSALGFVVLIFALLTSFSAHASLADKEWELKTDKQHVKVFVRKDEASSLYQFRAVSIIRTNVNSLINLMRDIDAMDSWLATCRDPVVIAEPDGVSRIIHMKNDSPFPIVISNRDLVLLQRFRRESESVVVVDLIDHNSDISPTKGYVRGEFNGHWKFTELNESEVEVEYQGLADPGGNVPPSLANLVVVDVPYNTLINIRKTLDNIKTKYDKPATIEL